MREIDAKRASLPDELDPPALIPEETPYEECLRIRHELEERGQFSRDVYDLSISAYNWGRSDGKNEVERSWANFIVSDRWRARIYLILGFVLGLVLMAALLR